MVHFPSCGLPLLGLFACLDFDLCPFLLFLSLPSLGVFFFIKVGTGFINRKLSKFVQHTRKDQTDLECYFSPPSQWPTQLGVKLGLSSHRFLVVYGHTHAAYRLKEPTNHTRNVSPQIYIYIYIYC